MDTVEIIGYAAALLTTISFLPQAIHTWKTQSVEDISLGMYGTFTLGVILWLIYGIIINNIPIILANTVTGSLSVVILILKIRHGNSNKKQEIK